jgi:hypothetical protein
MLGRAVSRAGPLIAALLLAGAAAAEPLSADRPGQANPPHVVAPGVIQVEGGLGFARQTQGQPDVDTFTLPELLLRLGLVRRVQLAVSADGFVYEDRSGASNRASGSDLALSTRVRLLEPRGPWPATALEFAMSFPTGGNAVTSDGYDPSGTLLVQWALGERLGLDANLELSGPTQGAGDSRRVFQVAPSLALGLELGASWQTYVEYFAALNTDGVSDEHSIDGGFAWLVTDDLQLDLSAGFGLVDAADDFFVGTGVAWRFRPR